MDLASIYRAEYGRCVATLARVLGVIQHRGQPMYRTRWHIRTRW
ncbi:hypothetical protein [Micromonospora sp. MA102]|nr:hypothetical protein [Micromonospora sp. MA102]